MKVKIMDNIDVFHISDDHLERVQLFPASQRYLESSGRQRSERNRQFDYNSNHGSDSSSSSPVATYFDTPGNVIIFALSVALIVILSALAVRELRYYLLVRRAAATEDEKDTEEAKQERRQILQQQFLVFKVQFTLTENSFVNATATTKTSTTDKDDMETDTTDSTHETDIEPSITTTSSSTNNIMEPIDDDIETCIKNSNDKDDGTFVHALDEQQPNSTCEVAATSVLLPEHALEHNTSRTVENQCAICLDSYSPGHEVVWSSNKQCPHVFHKDCILDYFVSVRSKERPCPMCRQSFCLLNDTKQSSSILSKSTNTPTSTIGSSNQDGVRVNV